VNSRPGAARPVSGRFRCTTRRTCASLLVAMDVHLRVVMQILRHSQIAVTMNVYSEVTSAETREALKRLGKSLESE
jgi:integrase